MASRTLTEVVGLLETQLRLLQKYRHEAFDEGNNDYLGEVAGKLRLLVSDEGSNKALLLRVMKVFGTEGKLILDEPGGKQTVTLRQFLDLEAFRFRDGSGEWVVFKNMEIVKTYCEKYGAAHVDWTVPDDFREAMDMEVYLGNVHHVARQMRSVADAVLEVGRQLLGSLTDKEIRKKSIKLTREWSCQTPAQHNAKGVALATLGITGEAVVCFERAIAGDPKAIHSRMNLGLALRRRERHRDAAAAYAAVLEIDSNHLEARWWLGAMLVEQGKYPEAREHFEHILRTDPSNADALYGRGCCLVQLSVGPIS